MKRQSTKDKELLKKLEEEIREEIEFHLSLPGCPTFIPSEYRRHRLNGLKPEEIDYDMCHIWR